LKNRNYKNSKIIKRELQDLLNINIKYLDSLFIIGSYNFGNFIISLNNAIIFCEIFHCKKIILQSNNNTFINNKIYYQKYNLIIENNSNIISTNNSLIEHLDIIYYKLNFSRLGNINRFHVFREEILNNIPIVKVHPDDLYIYIRGGDAFQIINKPCPGYAQPPLCFYENALNKYKFRKIRIISEDKSNPVLILLEKKYHIKYIKNDLKLDISYLANSYNIILAKSSFIVSIIKFNNNLKYVWEYDFYILSDRYLHLHYSVYTFIFNYTIYKMNASENYKKLMYPFSNSEKQRKFMIEEKCINYFNIILPRIS
jgi:hypothetical protein